MKAILKGERLHIFEDCQPPPFLTDSVVLTAGPGHQAATPGRGGFTLLVPLHPSDDGHGELGGEVQGRIHWVAVSSSHMGRGLAKVLLSAALQCIHRHHARCFLTTQTTSARAVGLYLQLGFVPLIAEAALAELSAQEGDGYTRTVAQELAAWQSIEHLLPASALQALPSL